MDNLVLNYNRAIYYLEKFRSENLGLYCSFVLHFLILLSMIGLPNLFGPKQILLPTIIPIEIVNVDDITSISKNPIVDSKSIETKNIKVKVKVKEKKFNSSDNQEIKKINIKDKPKINIKDNPKINIKDKPKLDENNVVKKTMLEKKEIVILNRKKNIKIELEKQEIKIDTNNFESLPTKKIKPRLKPKLNTKEVLKNKKSDLVIEVKPKKKSKDEFNIASMLKDLRNEKTIKEIKSDIEEKKKNPIEKTEEKKDNESAQLSISELDLVLQQLSRCFVAPAGAEIKKTMFVKISAKIQSNRRVYENSIRIVDTNISKSSPVYGPITESAMRTLLNPECIPLKLPEEKYHLWKNLTMKFDYSIMRGN